MNTAEYIVKRLVELGVNDFFGLPGDYNFNILYAIENNPDTNWIGCTNELNAGYAADGYARIKGYGAVVTTYGVGELSAINAIAGSMAENVPVVSIVGIPATKFVQEKTLLHHNLQSCNYKAFFNAYSSVTGASCFLSKDNAKLEIDRVLKILINEKKPVYIAIPDDIAQMEISDRTSNTELPVNKLLLHEVAQKIVDKISESKNPIIMGDILIKRFDALIEYKEFVEKLKIPVSNFLMGTNLIDMDYELYLGSYYSEFRNPVVQKYIDKTDCMISVGAIYSDLNAYGFNLPFKINNHIAIYGNCTYIEGKCYKGLKMADVLEAVCALAEPKNICINRSDIGYETKPESKDAITADYIYPRLQNFIKENDILMIETGMIPHGVALMKLPSNVNIQLQTLWGSIGWATPATLGACVAKPNSRVILITGEGAHQLTAMEIGNILRLGLKPVIIVVNNKGYTIERLLSNNPNDKFNDIVGMNYAKFARVFEGDVWATQVSTTEDFDKALKVTQIMNKMCYIEVVTDSTDAPQLTKDMANSMKERAKNAVSVNKVNNNLTKNDGFFSGTVNKDLLYETIVHKTFLCENSKQEAEK